MASAPFAPPDLRRCALRKARAGRSRSRRRREGGRCCRHRRHHVLPRQEEHPADHGEWGAGRGRLRLSLASCSLRRGRGALDPAGYPGPVPGEGRGPGVPGVESGGQPSRRAGRHPDGATLAFGGKQNKEETQSGAENFGLCIRRIHNPLISHQPVVSK